MRNKYVITRRENVKYVNEHLDSLVNSCLNLARYSDDDPLTAKARENFYRAFQFITEHPEIENDYQCMLQIHDILMDGLNNEMKGSLTDEQISELSEMINQPAKANVEISIDVMLYILDKRLFSDGDVRVAIMFANKIMVDNGCGIITVSSIYKEDFRNQYKNYQLCKDDQFKNWIYKFCIRGPKVEY